MGDVITIMAGKPDPGSLKGDAKCIGCGHEWVAIVDVGTRIFDCPSCGDSKGHFQGVVNPPDGAKWWICQCGANLFHIVGGAGAHCVQCGMIQSW